MTTLNLAEQSIHHLKNEIIAPDWRLSPKRIEKIEAALACLSHFFHQQKSTQGIVTMAQNVLGYLKKSNCKKTTAIDFLKESMAHIVSIFEEDSNQERQANILFRQTYKHFQFLKKQLPPLPEKLNKPQPLTTSNTQNGDFQLRDICLKMITLLHSDYNFSGSAITTLKNTEEEISAFIERQNSAQP